ncbi:hypothetical protein GCM10008986_16890 [Salinibacillus aidingensis]|uniref:Uncharacterized protein n=1 Tax=Salinibacillus aidingensis TaxID=237684 RepID=A0ABN1B732_9BACI
MEAEKVLKYMRAQIATLSQQNAIANAQLEEKEAEVKKLKEENRKLRESESAE